MYIKTNLTTKLVNVCVYSKLQRQSSGSRKCSKIQLQTALIKILVSQIATVSSFIKHFLKYSTTWTDSTDE